MKCQRGDLSFIFSGNAVPSESFVVLDNEQKVYQRIHHEVCETASSEGSLSPPTVCSAHYITMEPASQLLAQSSLGATPSINNFFSSGLFFLLAGFLTSRSQRWRQRRR